MRFRDYLAVAVRMTISITLPVGLLIGIAIGVAGGMTASGELEFERLDGLILIVLLPAISVILCVLVSPVARLVYALLDRGKTTVRPSKTPEA